MTDQLNLTELATLYGNEEAAREKLEQLRWPNGAICPHCESVKVYKLTPKADSKTAGRKGLWKCGSCRKQFSVTVNTVFEGSRIPLGKWIMAIYLICSSKKGMSALQLMRMLWPEDAQAKTPSGQWKKTHYKTAWFMAHRIRYAMSQEPLFSKLSGTVEADETYVGGKLKNMHADKRAIAKIEAGAQKAPVVTLVERDGRVKTRHMEHVTATNMREMLTDYVAHPETFLMTDQAPIYKGLNLALQGHESVDHHAKEYVRGNAHVNTAESTHALLKRGVFGTYHHWSKKHLHRYLSEFDFRWNHRKVNDGERTVAAIKSIGGKRLRYAQPTKKAEVLTLDQMASLYLDGKLTLNAIGKRLGITRQAVQERFATAKVVRRKVGTPETVIAKKVLVELYVKKEWTKAKIAKELHISLKRLQEMFDQYGIETRPFKRNDMVKYPQLANLKVGESIVIEMDKPLRKQYQVNFYSMAKRLGIKLACKALSDRTVRVTRVKH